MADSVILATAQRYNAVLWTQDSDFSGIEGVHYLVAFEITRFGKALLDAVAIASG
jgi:hypothetical protein